MPNRKISEFAVTAALAAADYLTIVSGGVNKIITWANAQTEIIDDVAMTPLSATAWVFASDANAYSLAFAAKLRAAGANVWVCDGTNDDVEIQAAIDAVVGSTSGTGKVLLSEGQFNISTTIAMDDDVTLEGMMGIELGAYPPDDVGTTVLKGAADLDDTVISATSKVRMAFRNFKINGGYEDGNAGGDGIYLDRCVTVTFENVSIQGCQDSGFHIEDSTDTSPPASAEIFFTNCRADVNWEHGFYIDNVSDISMVDCWALANYGGYGILLNACATATIMGAHADSNAVSTDDPNDDSIGIGITGSIVVTIANCTCIYNGKIGINLSGSDHITCVGNVCYYDGEYGSAGGTAGIVVYDCDDFTVVGNTTVGNSTYPKYGILIYAYNGYGVVTGNTVADCATKNLYYETGGITVTVAGNGKHIEPGEIKHVSKAITAGAQNTVTSIQNVFGSDVLILEAFVAITTADPDDAPTYDMGTDDDGTGAPSDGNNLFNAIPDTAGYYRSMSNGLGGAASGVQTAPILWTFGGAHDYVNFQIVDDDGDGTVGRIYIEVMGK